MKKQVVMPISIEVISYDGAFSEGGLDSFKQALLESWVEAFRGALRQGFRPNRATFIGTFMIEEHEPTDVKQVR